MIVILLIPHGKITIEAGDMREERQWKEVNLKEGRPLEKFEGFILETLCHRVCMSRSQRVWRYGPFPCLLWGHRAARVYTKRCDQFN